MGVLNTSFVTTKCKAKPTAARSRDDGPVLAGNFTDNHQIFTLGVYPTSKISLRTIHRFMNDDQRASDFSWKFEFSFCGEVRCVYVRTKRFLTQFNKPGCRGLGLQGIIRVASCPMTHFVPPGGTVHKKLVSALNLLAAEQDQLTISYWFGFQRTLYRRSGLQLERVVN